MTDTEPDTPAEFEANLEALEALVARMESGELGLEQSLGEFQQGIELARRCQKALDDAQRRMEALTGDSSPDSDDPPGEPNVPSTGPSDATDPDVPF
ncbi:MAG: exodeoxyribonuclease VII small subunit [Pseudomonadota bacterium]